MLPKFDVLVENFAPGAVARMGLDYDTVKEINPRIVMCSISMAGQTGELSTQPGFDYMASAYGGITSAIGEGDRGPVQVPIAMGDSATGVSAAMAVGFALLHRERNGEGQHIDCSLLDTYVQMHEELILASAFAAKRQFLRGQGLSTLMVDRPAFLTLATAVIFKSW